MILNIKRLCFFVLLVEISMSGLNVFAQNPVCVYCGTSLPNGIHTYPCKYAINPNSTTKSSSGSSESLNNMVAGAIFQSVLKSILSSNSGKNQKELDAKQRAEELAAQQAAHQAAEQQRIDASNAQAEYEKMMRSYKLLDDSQSLSMKNLNSTSLGFKSLNGDAETLASDARKQFENTSVVPVSDPSKPGNATPFFGDTMPLEDLQTLMNPENNPNIIDLKDAKTYMDESIKKDSLGIVSLLRQYESAALEEPIIQKPECKILTGQLKAFTNQRQQFQKTVDLSGSEVDVWETANRNAMINAAKDGLEYFTGQWLEKLTNRGKAADRLQRIYDKNVIQMTKDGIDVAGLQSKIETLRNISSAGQIADLAANMNDWQTFVKDGMSSLIDRLEDSNNEIQKLIDDPRIDQYFEMEKPELNTLLDISKLASTNMVFGKWVAKKIPLIACIELSIKEVYNGFDYLLSLNRIIKAKKINAGVLEAAKYIQKNIDDTYLALSNCQ